MIEPLALTFMLVLARVVSFVALVPVLGGQLPRTVKLGLSVALTILSFGADGTVPPAAFLSGAAKSPWLVIGLAMGREIVIGAVLGYAFSLFLMPVRIAGEYIGEEMGLALSGQIDPTADHSAGTVTQLLQMMATLLFLGLDCHHFCIASLYSTFSRWPVGVMNVGLPMGDLVNATAAVEEWGLLLAAPVGVCLFLTSIVLALLARLAPQLNVFNLGFALRVGVGLIALLVLLPGIVAGVIGTFNHFGQFLQRLL